MSEASGIIELGSYEVKLMDKLGQGTFGVVFRGKHKKKGEIVAVKQCEITTDQYGFMAMKEIKNFQQLENHPNIVQLRDFHFFKNSFWMVMEFCDAGDLVKYIKTTNPNFESKINIMYQCASAIAYMHTRPNPVVHRDIKPANIMMKTEKDGNAVVKVTDFGLSKVIEDADPGMTMMFSTAAGTPGFMAPEFYTQEKYTDSVDIFAMGLVFLSLIDFKKGDRELIPLSAQAKRLKMIMPVGQEMAQLGKMNMPIPELVEDDSKDSAKMKSVKKLIRNMAAFETSKRKPMVEVERELAKIGGSSTGPIPPPVAKKPASKTNAELAKDQERRPPAENTRDVAAKSMLSTSSFEGSGEVGFQLLKDALEEAVRDKVTKTSEASFLDRGMKDMPLTSLIAQAMGGDRHSDKFNVGDRIRVDKSIEKARVLQEKHGEWNDQMTYYLGKEGLVKEKVFHVVKVQFDDGQVWSYNPKLLHLLHESDDSTSIEDTVIFPGGKSMHSGMFKRYDVVRIPDDEELVKCLQKNHGGWNPKMKHCLGVKGIVNRTDKDGDVFVECINGDDWTLNPEMLTHVDMKSETVEAGDFVIVRDDRAAVKKKQEDHGGWVEGMATGLGKSGIVQSVIEDKAKVETRGKSFIWNIDTLVLVAKGEEMLRAVLQKKIAA